MTQQTTAPETVTRMARRIDVEGLEQELKRRVDGEVRFDKLSRAIYDTDGSNYKMIPIGVVVPKSKEGVVATVETCHSYGAPILSRGCGTSLAGQTCNTAVVMDFSKYMYNVLEIDPDRRLARVQPGCILDHLRSQAEQRHHLTFGPDPATHSHCTLGGMIGNNSCGVHSVMAGRTADNIEQLEIVTYDGLRMRVGRTSDEELERIIRQGGRRGEIYHGMKRLRDRYADLIRRKYPDIPRRVSGYNLDELLPEKGFHVARALVGSESTLVTVLEATLNLVHSPPSRTLVVLGYPDIYSAGDHVTEIMQYKPVGLEAIDDLLIEFNKRKHIHLRDLDLLPGGGGWLLVEFGGESKEESDAKGRGMMETLGRQPNPPTMRLYDDPSIEKHVWEVRESGLGATFNVPGEPLGWPGWEDAAVRPDTLGSYLRKFRALLDKHGLRASLYGHFGQACVHCRISFDMMSQEGIDNYMSFIQQAADLVLEHGGSLSGEHGDGQSRAWLLTKMFGPELIQAFEDFKTLWDPDWKMNPGKVVRPYRPDQNLRLGAGYKPWDPPTHFKFPDDHGSFARAALRCVGVGKCRRPETAFMCPSFVATREEKDTTRGRARALFEMCQRDFLENGWNSDAVKETLDLCLACKGCKSECPVNVDMATYKAEFLSHYYETHPRPLAAYSMGRIGLWAKLGEKMPRLANFAGRAPGLSTISKAVGGISPHRPMPPFARQTFMQWWSRREPRNTGGRPVLVYPDVFNDTFHPNVLQAIVLVLERYGLQPVVPKERPPAIRPLIDFGWLEETKEHLQQVMRQFQPYVAQAVPIIVAEPSTASVYRDELPNLMPDNEFARQLTSNVHLLSEYIDKQKLAVPKLSGKVVFHGHCHQKAVLNVAAARNVLHSMGLEMVEPEPGCCGMAGSFGMETDKYEISMKIAEQNLLPAVREASEDTYIVADGFSCRMQIADGSKRHAIHMAELLLLAFEKSDRLSPPNPAAPVT